MSPIKHFYLHHRALVLGLLMSTIGTAAVNAAELELSLPLNYRVVDQVLDEQLFTGPERTVEVYADSKRCNTMQLSHPRVEGTDAGQVLIFSTITARAGTPVGKRCLLAKTWSGILQTVHQVEVDPPRSALVFNIVDSNILRSDEHQSAVPKWLQRSIRDSVIPRFSAIVLDIQPVVDGIGELVGSAWVTTDPEVLAMASSLQITAAVPSPPALDIVLALAIPDSPGFTPPDDAAVLTEAELAEWDAAWQAWDGFITWLILTTAADAEEDLVKALADTLLQARYELRDALARDERNRDPVRELFLSTWERLAPLLHASQADLPGAEALRFATFIAGADALRSLDQLSPYSGLRLDQHSLRNLARLLVPVVTESELDYQTKPNPLLRGLLGLDPEFDVEKAESSLLDWFIPSAHAAEGNRELLNQLNGWVPNRLDIDQYLPLMAQLLDEISRAEREKGKVPSAQFSIYETLFRATAWQESCWRQYIEKEGNVESIQSPAGSVGLMQVNKHVWRGVYDIDSLMNDVGYNARAGNEILVHYLVDYAIRKREHTITGDESNLARATYAAYNGGPGHLSRYRKADRSGPLKDLDDVFWDKYLAIQDKGPSAVKQCYLG